MPRPNLLPANPSTTIYVYKLNNQPYLVGICLKNYGLIEDEHGAMMSTTVMSAESAREVAAALVGMAEEAEKRNSEAVA